MALKKFPIQPRRDSAVKYKAPTFDTQEAASLYREQQTLPRTHSQFRFTGQLSGGGGPAVPGALSQGVQRAESLPEPGGHEGIDDGVQSTAQLGEHGG